MKQKTPSELSVFFQFVRPSLLTIAFLSLIIGLIGFTSTVYMLEVYDRVINSRSLTTLLMLTLAALGAYALMDLLELYRNRLLWSLGLQFETSASQRVHQAVFNAVGPRARSAHLHLLQDLKTVRDVFTNPAVGAALELPIALVSVVLIFVIHPLLGWVALAGALLHTTVAWLMQISTRTPLMQARQSSEQAQAFAEGSLRNAQVMDAMGLFEGVRHRWQTKQDAFLLHQAQASEVAGTFNTLSRSLQHLMGSVLLGVSAWLLIRNELNGGAGMLIISAVLGGRMLTPVTQIVQQWPVIQTALSSWSRLNAVLADLPAPTSGMALPAPRGHLSVEGVVAMAPGHAAPVLRGVRFSLQPGQALAVVGPSASGKTTLARILAGVWPAQTGKVRLDGADLHAWDKQALGPHIGYLPQSVELLEGSIAENICRFGDMNPAQVEEAARLAGAHAFITNLPEGYQTLIGSEGLTLSGGQRQLVALARAFYGHPVFLVLDEPDASLDDAGEQALQNAVLQLRQRGSVLVINTHRKRLLSVADQVLVLQEGVVQKVGPTREVLAGLKGGRSGAQTSPATGARAS